MSDKQKAFLLLAMVSLFWLVVGGICGFFIGKAKYNVPIVETVTRDTVVVVDTAFYDRPIVKDSISTKYVTRWLPAKHDTIDHFVEVSKMMHDTVAVEVPITSKHYGSDTYDAWVSGFEPSLDSIRVYQQTKYITETITVTNNAKRKPWGIGFTGGYGYDFTTKTAAPFIGVGISYNILNF